MNLDSVHATYRKVRQTQTSVCKRWLRKNFFFLTAPSFLFLGQETNLYHQSIKQSSMTDQQAPNTYQNCFQASCLKMEK